MADDKPTRHIHEGHPPSAVPSSLKGLTMALGIEPAKPGHDPLLGCDIGGVTIVRLIAEGGMGRVYQGKQEKPNRTVAVKVMRPGLTSPSILKRFEYEAEVLGRLQHPGIAHIYSVGVHRMGHASVPYFIMEYIADARTLTNYAEELKLPTRQRLDLFRAVCDAVAHGHHKGVIHRDLKPSNILVDAAGQPKVIDFGVARATDSDMALTTMQTDVGQLIGTLQYMSPEQFKADPHDIDVRSDVYALGVILYELLAGNLPYDVKKKAIHEVARIVQEDDPTPLSSFNRALKGDVAVIAGKCLEKDRAHRYSSASELGSDIGRYLSGESISASPPGFVDGLIRLARKHRVAAAALAGVFASLVAAVVGIGIFANRAEVARMRAEEKEAEATKQKERAEAQSRLAAEERDRAEAHEAESRRQKELAEKERAKAVEEAERTKKQLYVAQLFRVAAMLESDNAPPPSPALINGLLAFAKSERPVLEVNCLRAQFDRALLIVPAATCFALNADGSLLATGHGDGTIRLWETATGAEQATLTGHQGPVRDIALHGADRIASVAEDGFMRLWTRADGRAHSSVEAAAGKPTAVAFAPDGLLLATAGVDRTVALWHGLTGERLRRVEVHFEAGRVMFSGDGTRLCVGPRHVHGQAGGRGVSVLGMERDAEPVAMKVDGEVTCVAISPDGRHVAVSNRLNYTDICDASTGKRVHRLGGHRAEVNTVAYSADGELLVTGGNDGRAVVWNTQRSEAMLTLAVDPLHVLSAAFSHDGNRLVTGGQGGDVKAWDTTTGACVSLMRGAASRVTRLESGRHGCGVVSYSMDGRVRLWGAEQQPNLGVCSQPTRDAALAISPDGKTVAMGGERGVAIWDCESCLKIATVGDRTFASDSLAFSPDGGRVLSGGGGKIRVWDRLTGKQELEVPARAGHLAVAWSPLADRVASAGSDGVLRQWNVPSGEEIQPLIPEEGPIERHTSNSNSVCYSSDGRFVASSSLARGVLLWEVATGRSLWPPADDTERSAMRWSGYSTYDPRAQPAVRKRGPCGALCFTPDGSALAGAGYGEIAMWGVRTGRRVNGFKTDATVRELAFGGTPGRIVTGGLDGAVRVLDPAEGTELAVLRGHSSYVSGVACSADGTLVASSSRDGTLRFWGRSNAEVFASRRRYGEAEQRLDDRITAWLREGPDAAVAKLRESKASLTPEEYRVAGNMILSRSAASHGSSAVGGLPQPGRPSPDGRSP